MNFSELEDRLLNKNDSITFEEALGLTDTPKDKILELTTLARKVTLKYKGDGVFLRSIVSAKTGDCSEDCSFCSQSVHFSSPISKHSFLDPDEVLQAALESEKMGAFDFCIVIAVKGPNKQQFEKILESIDLIKKNTKLEIGCSLGSLTQDQARGLANAGVWRYNHNIETCKEFFPNICSTHTYEDRANTARLVKEVGMELCCGGIIGMGETVKQRIQLAFEIKDLDPHTVPMNFLNPRPGTPLGHLKPLPSLEAIKTIAIFRLIMPDKVLMSGGGREVTLGDLQSMGLMAGSNGMIIGNYLTTVGRDPKEDLKMIKDLQMPIRDRYS
ncbi:MAG: biotin synthase BioB [Spirochaetales bacterium]|nr:biotin synthase BioB [Spirochaetales bacterium]|tara:strand:- start:203 stop:1186 length:984 start_codon:yes stop_codon:yes gene_type:complete